MDSIAARSKIHILKGRLLALALGAAKAGYFLTVVSEEVQIDR